MPHDDTANDPPLDYSPSSGAVGSHEHNYDDAPQAHDGRAETHTKFYPEEAADDSRNWERMARMQDGAYDIDDAEYRSRVRTVGRQQDLAIFADTLSLTKEQETLASHLLDAVTDTEPFSSNEALLLALCTIAVNRSTHHVPADADAETERELRQLQGDPALRELRDICDVTKTELRKARRTARRQFREDHDSTD